MELRLSEVFTFLGKLILSWRLNISWGRVNATHMDDLGAAQSLPHQTPNKQETAVLSTWYSVWNTTLGDALLFWISNLGIQNNSASRVLG